LKIGIISDTHGSLPVQVHAAFANVDYILHAGDIGSMRIIDELETIAPVEAVCGNCDSAVDFPFNQWLRFTLEDTNILMAHTPKDLNEAIAAPSPSADLRPHIAIHGHTHVPKTQRIGKILYLCPGSATRPREGSAPSVILLDVQGNNLSGLHAGVQIINLLKSDCRSTSVARIYL
jgi:putative phosphoesterase